MAAAQEKKLKLHTGWSTSVQEPVGKPAPGQQYVWRPTFNPLYGNSQLIPRDRWFPVFTPNPHNNPLYRQRAENIRHFFDSRPNLTTAYQPLPVSRVPDVVVQKPLPPLGQIRVGELGSYVSALFRTGAFKATINQFNSYYRFRWLNQGHPRPLVHLGLGLMFVSYLYKYPYLRAHSARDNHW